jgi:signal transduction histidine kinase
VQAVTLTEVEDARVVVVDDNLPSAQLVQALLARAGLPSVPAVTEGRELLAKWDTLDPELILLDLHMPGMDGYAVLAEVRRRATAAELPVLVLTADTTREATHRALELGANDFLTKPLDAAELVLRVRNLLQARALHAGLERRHSWLNASEQLARELLSGACADPLRRVCELARDAADADLAVITTPLGEPTFVIGDAQPTAPETVAAAFERRVLQPGKAVRIDDLGVATGLASVGPAILVPLLAAERLLGALLLCRAPARRAFSETDFDLAVGFASQAAVAVEFAEARADQEHMVVLADRHRIARDLHDQVIQRLFATGLRLQQLASQLEPGSVAERLDEQVGDLDDTITQIRSTIFGLRLTAAPDRLPTRLRQLAGELTGVLGYAPELCIDEPLDNVPDDVADDLVAAAREAVSNVARHARARRVGVSVRLTDAGVMLEVSDDGIGIGDADRRSGLTNLCERARRHGGTCTIGPAAGGGTHVVWTAPVAVSSQPSAAVMATGR